MRLNSKIRKQITIARIPVNVSTPLTENELESVVTYVTEKYNKHERSIGYKSDDEKKNDALVITLLDIAAELFTTKNELKKIKQMDSETFIAVDLLSKQLDEISKTIEE